MDILPAIDLIDGKCVRLLQGQYDKQITYGDSPSDQAKDFISQAAQWIHVIDLDGAKAGRPMNLEAIKSIVELGKLKVEVGGGIRDEDSIKCLLDTGVERLIIGTRAVKEFSWFEKMCEKFPGKLVLGLDGRDSKVATDGWLEETEETIIGFAQKAARVPIAAIIYTDISKDGMLEGPNLERTKMLVDSVDVPVVAAGGVTTVDDITHLGEVGVAGAVIGRALYEGTITVKDAVKVAG
ncbi:MAG: 1-(5-phosphoribosyl)-5-[(5-phosphoribosylamino)methylideneamino]imidazole-4-carboxamide isomerase [Sedimentisphaeraceae bacterium JB056]